jgi:glutaredoxin 3
MAEVVIYTTKWCPYCIRAKSLLDKLATDYQEIAVDSDPALRNKMMELSGRHTVPQIFINGLSIGGCDDLMALHSSGELTALLADA